MSSRDFAKQRAKRRNSTFISGLHFNHQNQGSVELRTSKEHLKIPTQKGRQQGNSGMETQVRIKQEA